MNPRQSLPGIAVRFFALLFFVSPLGLFAAEPSAEKFLTLWAGTLPIVISAPHGGREAVPGVALRRGVGVERFVTARDNRTDELAETIAVKLAQSLGDKPHLVVARFERKYIDVNRPRNAAYESESAKIHYDAYHQWLVDACKRVRSEWGHGLLLDIHGEGADREAIFRGTNNGQTVLSLTRRFGREALNGTHSIVGQLAQKGYKVFPGNGQTAKEQHYTGGHIVQTYGSHKQDGIDAMQLEFGTNLRSRTALDRTASDVAEAVTVFAKTYLPTGR